MSGIRFPTFAEILELQRIQIDTFGGSHGLRDEGLLRSALAQPEMQFGGNYVHADVAAMAGAYLFHLAKNHPFVDGNKRLAAATALLFLALNGRPSIPDPQQLGDLTLEVAAGAQTKDQAIQFFRRVLGNP
jgi:death-on-curing protein